MVRFAKMQGLGNDFVVIEGPVPGGPEQVRAWCDRRVGIGADGVLEVGLSDLPPAIARMRYWNADGTPAEMCGNGLRCAARYLFDRGLVDSAEFVIETDVGFNRVEVRSDSSVRVELGGYSVGSTFEFGGIDFTAADIGNPHAVAFLDDEADLGGPLLEEVGPELQTHSIFPQGVNVELAVRRGINAVLVRVWERGIGETQACGTGAAAVLAVAASQGRMGSAGQVLLKGGVLAVTLDDNSVWIEGPAVEVFEGVVRS